MTDCAAESQPQWITGNDKEAQVQQLLPAESDDSPLLDALEGYLEFAEGLFDQPRAAALRWEGNASGIAVRSVGRVIARWDRMARIDRPPLTLVVRLARRLPSILLDVCRAPRRILQRTRDLLPLHKLREMDSQCVQWLARQPGVSVVEKAGHRRRVLAIQRFESADTPENRITADLIKRCEQMAMRYLRQHESRYPSHPWIVLVRKFRSRCQILMRDSELSTVGHLSRMPQPNYVLIHEPRYRVIWAAYQQVVKQQRRREQLRQYRRETWTEMCQVAIWSSLSRLARRSPALRSDLWFRETPVQGRFFDMASPPAPWNSGQGNELLWIDGQQLGQIAPDLERSLGLSVDWAITTTLNLSGSAARVLLGWCFPIEDSAELLAVRERINDIEGALDSLKQKSEVNGVVILGIEAGTGKALLPDLPPPSSASLRIEIVPLGMANDPVCLKSVIGRWLCHDRN